MTLHRKKDLQKGKVKMTRDEAKVMERQTDRQTVVLATVEETVWELFLLQFNTHTSGETAAAAGYTRSHCETSCWRRKELVV